MDLDHDHDIIDTGRGCLFPVRVAEAEHGRYEGIGYMVVTMMIGTEDVGYIPWYTVRNLN